jgi:hypothetical protein
MKRLLRATAAMSVSGTALAATIAGTTEAPGECFVT